MKRTIKIISLLIVAVIITGCATPKEAEWAPHDMNRPLPPIVTPGSTTASPPSDAIVLFDGSDFSAWEPVEGGGDVKWKIKNDYMEVVPKSGWIQTKQPFGSCQLHIEWATPEVVDGKGQGRGNSGVFLMSQYELQILDSYQNPTYADGHAGAIYGQNPPLVNVSRGPGQWQSYDIVFHAPVFKGKKVVKPATMLVFQNGVLIQDPYYFKLKGRTFWKELPYYEPHPDKLPLKLQDHKNTTRFRNIWIRPLED